MNNHVSKSGIVVGVTDILSKLNERLAYNGEEIDEKTTSKGNVAVTRKYKLVNKKGDKESLTVTNPELIESIDKIYVAERASNVMGYVICRELAKISDSGMIPKMGFKNIADFARCVFGFATSTANHYAKIGKYFITDEYKVVEGLPDLSISHFIELNAKVGEDGSIQSIVDMYLDGTLVDGMSTKQLRLALSKSNKIIDTTAKEESSEEGKTEATEQGKATATKNTEQGNTIGTDNSKGVFDAQVEIQKALDSVSKFIDAYTTLVDNGFAELPNWREFMNSILVDLSDKLKNIDVGYNE